MRSEICGNAGYINMKELLRQAVFKIIYKYPYHKRKKKQSLYNKGA